MGVIRQYMLCVEPTIAGLIQKVNEMIAEGWTPQGGIGTSPHEEFFQAMVTDKKP